MFAVQRHGLAFCDYYLDEEFREVLREVLRKLRDEAEKEAIDAEIERRKKPMEVFARACHVESFFRTGIPGRSKSP